MIYKIRLNDRVYEVEVVEGIASVKDIQEVVVTPVAAPAPAPAPVAAPVPASAPAPVAAPVPASAPAPAAAPVPATVSSSGVVVKSPLPGSVLDVKVSTGAMVKKGDVVVVIEAMKMENEITAASDGKVGQIFVSKGSQVSTGQPMLELL